MSPADEIQEIYNPQNDSWFQHTWFRLVRFGFRLLYNEMAWSYDLVSWVVSLGRWRQWQLAAVPHLQGQRILEIAHGPGHMLLELGQKGFQVYGADLSPAMGRQAARRISRAGLSPLLARSDSRLLPFRSASFDSLLSTFPAEFIVDPRTIQEMFRILIPGGRVVIVPEGRLEGEGFLRRLISWLFIITGQRFDLEKDGGASELWPRIQNRFLEEGFKVAIERVHLEDSSATIVILDKPSTNN